MSADALDEIDVVDVEGIADDSTTNTFFAARLWIDTDRWRGVPFLLHTGKMMGVSRQRVSLVFRRPEGPLGNIPPDGAVLSFDLSGDGEIDIAMTVKEPGADDALSVGHLGLPLDTLPQGHPLAPYSRLIPRRGPGLRIIEPEALLPPARSPPPAGCTPLHHPRS